MTSRLRHTIGVVAVCIAWGPLFSISALIVSFLKPVISDIMHIRTRCNVLIETKRYMVMTWFLSFMLNLPFWDFAYFCQFFGFVV